ncbi:MAG: hypothetical protein JW793_01470 [Acidobacteria bacterium]|nr:hypothetical protein [Acidobacteriota bacterium]
MDIRNPDVTIPSGFIDSSSKVLHRKILQASQNASVLRGGLVEIYRAEVLTQKTRTVRLLGVKCTANIIQTLLGYEVQAMHKRIHCPDLVTARYLKLFSDLGCHSIRLPYDPTLTARLIPDMEASLNRLLDIVSGIFPRDPKRRQYVIRKLFAIVRKELRNAA